MRVINTSEIDSTTAARDRLVFVKQHSDAHRFHCWRHPEAVVVAENRVERSLQQRA
jgi:hypothetical protein